MPLARRATWRATVALAYRRADAMLAVSDALARDVRNGLGLRGPITDVGSGIEVPPDAPRRANREPEIAFLGRLSHEKAPDVFVEIAALLGCRAKVYGDGPLAPTVAAAAAANPQFEYVGWADRDEALLGTDVLVVPSRREARGLVVMEAGARRVCVVARDTGGIGEVLGRDPELARRCLVPSEAKAVDFAGVIRPLLQDAELRSDMGARLHDVVATHFTLQAHVDRLLEALVSVPGVRRGR
jgi:glycosyltransferase involved in cell wall biosynthesis